MHAVAHLLIVGVILLGGGQHFTQVIHRPLDWQCFAFFLSFHNYDCADHSAGGSDVEKHGLLSSRSCQDRRSGQHLFELEKSFIRLVVPLEKSGLLHELVQGKTLLAQPTDETADGCQAAGKFLHVQQSGGRLHPLDGLDLHRLHSMPCFETKKPRSWLAGTPKTHFSGLSLI